MGDLRDNRLTIITGHYGSGKTEFAVNYSIKSLNSYNKVVLADLDIVNPYFRSREKAAFLKNMGIRVIGSSMMNSSMEIPALTADINGAIDDKTSKTIMDIGGDPVGARVLARYSNQISMQGYDMFIVVNANRPETQTVEAVKRYMNNIELSSGLKISGLINNTHLLRSTSIDDLLKGHELCQKVTEDTGIPIVYEVAIRSIADMIKDPSIKIFPIDLYMREDWMS
ncbi:MAG: ATP-binding protein [Eubacteriales bacterium]|nr:ATP-binding protein [Eubacteriales bacterium]